MEWLLASDEPWTRCRTLMDLLDRSETFPEVLAAKEAMLAHPQIKALLRRAASWFGDPLQRHNRAHHPLVALSALTDCSTSLTLQCNWAGKWVSLDALCMIRSLGFAFQCQA